MNKDTFLQPSHVYGENLSVLLLTIRQELQSLPHFPSDYCDVASEVVHHFTGFEMMGGYYLQCYHHYWNYDPRKGLYLDFTRDQFEDDAPPISIFSSRTKLYTQNDFMTQEIRAAQKSSIVETVLPTLKETLHRVIP